MNNNNNNNLILPVKSYENADIQKIQILKENRGKSGVYRWKNKTNQKTYIGSSISLYLRLKVYYSFLYLAKAVKKNNSLIYKALLKYGYSGFSLEILEYCPAEKCIEREQYYIDNLPHEYNILSIAGSPLGFKHSEETRVKQSVANKGENNPMYGKKRKHSEETRAKQSAANKGENNPMFGKTRAVGAGSPSKKIKVLDLLTNESKEYDSISAAGKSLGLKSTRISNYLSRNQKKAYMDRYIFTKI